MMMGFLSFVQGYLLLWQSRRLKIYAIIPFVGSFIFFVASLVYGWQAVAPVFASWMPALSGFWSEVARTLISVTAFFIFAIILGVLSLLVANVFLAPFNSMLAEQVLRDLGVLTRPSEAYFQALKSNLRMLGVSLLKSLGFLIVGIILFAVSVIPTLALITWFAGCLLLSFDFADYSFEALRMNFRQRWNFFRSHLPQFIGFALALGFTFFIPGANLILLPGAVVGSSILVAKIKRSQT